MKRIITALAALLLLTACGAAGEEVESRSEEVPADYGRVIELAQAEFAEAFREFEDLEVEETVTAGWTGNPERAIVQFRYSSGNGDGVYGFEYQRDDGGNIELLRRGEDVGPV